MSGKRNRWFYYNWLLAVVLFFQIMDLVTTWMFLSIGDSESNPIAHSLWQHYGFPGIAVYKIAGIVFFVSMSLWLFRSSEDEKVWHVVGVIVLIAGLAFALDADALNVNGILTCDLTHYCA